MLNTFRCLTLSTCLLLAASAVNAGTIGPITTSTPVPTTLTDWSSNLLFPQFDASLGTLLSVELTTAIRLVTQLTVTNHGGGDSSGTARTEVSVTLSDPGLFISQSTDTLWPVPAYSYTLTSGESVTSPHFTKLDSTDQTYTDGGILAEFTGPGNINLPASTFTQTVLSNTGGNTSADQTTTASATGTVTYTYQAASGVPEPATIVLFGSALVGLGLLRRKRLLR